MSKYPAGSYEAIAWEWFPRMADRFGRPLDPDTVDAYVRAFRAAEITTGGLTAACETLFGDSKWWPSPAAFIAVARSVEAQRKRDERPAGTIDGPDAERSLEDRLAAAKTFAQPWVDANRAEYDRLVATINAEVVYRFKLADVRAMSPTQREFRDATIITECAQRAYEAVRATNAEIIRTLPPKLGWDQKIAKARASVAEMFAKGKTTAGGSSPVSAGSHLEPGTTP